MKITPYKILNFAASWILNRIQRFNYLSPVILCMFENIAAIVLMKEVRFSYNKAIDFFVAQEGCKKRFFSNFERGTWLYRNGLEQRANFIFKSYCLQNLKFNSGDVVIDCGANSGDLSLKLFEVCSDLNYIAVEPSPDDYKVLTKNITDGNALLINKALGDKNETLKFYICTEKGDSSLIEPSSYTNMIDVDVVRLDTLIKNFNVKKIKLIKIEAEGYELEILKGSQGALEKVEYIAIDGGYERGITNEQTFTVVTNFLLDHGYEMLDIYFPWNRALFQNKSFKKKRQ